MSFYTSTVGHHIKFFLNKTAIQMRFKNKKSKNVMLKRPFSLLPCPRALLVHARFYE